MSNFATSLAPRMSGPDSTGPRIARDIDQAAAVDRQPRTGLRQPPNSRLALYQVSKSYTEGSVRHGILREVTHAFPLGLTVVGGPSGSGKSTLLNILGGLDWPDSGHVAAGGRKLGRDPYSIALHRRECMVIFQDLNLVPHLSVFDNILLPCLIQGMTRGEAAGRVDRALTAVGAGSWARRYPSQLSRGQRQRVAIARASFAPIILADEPTASLDRDSAQEMMKLLRELAQQNRTVVVVTHDLELAGDCANEILECRDGQLLRPPPPVASSPVAVPVSMPVSVPVSVPVSAPKSAPVSPPASASACALTDTGKPAATCLSEDPSAFAATSARASGAMTPSLEIAVASRRVGNSAAKAAPLPTTRLPADSKSKTFEDSRQPSRRITKAVQKPIAPSNEDSDKDSTTPESKHEAAENVQGAALSNTWMETDERPETNIAPQASSSPNDLPHDLPHDLSNDLPNDLPNDTANAATNTLIDAQAEAVATVTVWVRSMVEAKGNSSQTAIATAIARASAAGTVLHPPRTDREYCLTGAPR